MEEDFKSGEERGLMIGEMKAMRAEITQLAQSFNNFTAGIGQRLSDNEKSIGVLSTSLKVLEEQVNTMRYIVYGFVGLILVAVVTALVKMVMR